MDTDTFIFVIVFICIIVEGRLLHKNKTKTLEAVPTEHPNPTIRFARDIDHDFLTGFSREEPIGDEFLQFFNKRHNTFFPDNSIAAVNAIRTVRDSSEHGLKNGPRTDAPATEARDKQKRVLVKKPIPKFQEIDYEDDFQLKMNKLKTQTLFIESGDNEDQDFNLEDYDFDVNHDEFISGRKPLVPRISIKTLQTHSSAPEIRIPHKVGEKYDQHRQTKREGPSGIYSKEAGDYYDEATTAVSRKHKSQESSDSDYSDEDDSKEADRKMSQVRSIRSWDLGNYLTKIGDKTADFMSKVLTVLPMFPQNPSEKDTQKH